MSDTPTVAMVPRQAQVVAPRWRMAPSSLGEAMEMARLIAGSELCPKAYRNKPADCIVAYEYGASLGLSWMQALRNVAVINGIPSIYGDALPALIYGSGECERFHEYFEGTSGEDTYTAVCIMKRKGFPDEVRRTFSIADAKRANLWGKQGPWVQYSDRMQQFRARSFAARDTFADKLSGLILAEEAMDYSTIDGTIVESETVPSSVAVSLLDKLPEALRDNIEKAFETLNMSAGARLAKINEHLGGEGVDAEEGAKALLEWCRDEFAKRKTGQPRAKKGNGKEKSTSSEPPSASLEGSQAPHSGSVVGDTDGRSAATEAPAAAATPSAPNPIPEAVVPAPPQVEEPLF